MKTIFREILAISIIISTLLSIVGTAMFFMFNVVTNHMAVMFLISFMIIKIALVCDILTVKVGLKNCFMFEIFKNYKKHSHTFYIKPWEFFLPVYRKHFPRNVWTTENMPDEIVEQIKNSKMDSKHDHLNKFYDDTH